MKKILFIALMFLVPFLASGQNFIRDKYNYIQVVYSNDTTLILKSSIEKVKYYYGNVYLISNSVANNNAIYGYYLLKPSDFPQFASASAMYNFLKIAASNGYTEQLFYTGTAIDSIQYKINGARQYSKRFSYTGSNITGVTIVY